MSTSRLSKAETSSSPNIAVTGTASFLGSTLLRALERDGTFKNILAIDLQPPPFKLKKGKWEKMDLTQTGVDQNLNALFKKYRIDTVIHAALLNQPIRNLEQSHELQSVGTMHLLIASASAKIKKLILASTTDVYGAFPENPNFLTEDQEPRGGLLSPFLKDKVEVEEQFLRFQKEHPKTCVTLLRPATILGPTVNNFKTHFLQNTFVPTVLGFDPLIQFVHETDVMNAFLKVIHENHPGIYNIVARGVLPLSRAIQILGKVPLPIPTFLLYPSAEVLWYLNIGVAPGSHINFLKYLCVASGTRAWEELKFRPVYTSRETLLSFTGRGLKKEEIRERLRSNEA